MDDLSIKVFRAIKEKTHGLPGFCRLLAFELVGYLNIETGRVKLDKTLAHLVSEDFYVEQAPGRKQEPITPDTIRNAFRTIKKFRGEHFKFRTEGQRIVIEMPFIQELYAEHIKSEEVTAVDDTDDNGASSLGGSGFDDDIDSEEYKENTREVTAVSSPIYKQTKQTKTYKQTRTEISPDFYPSPETIKLACERGLEKV